MFVDGGHFSSSPYIKVEQGMLILDSSPSSTCRHSSEIVQSFVCGKLIVDVKGLKQLFICCFSNESTAIHTEIHYDCVKM